MQGDAHGIRDGAVDGGGDQWVDEFERVGAGEDAGVAEPVGAIGGRFAAEARDGGGECGRDFGAEYGAGPGEAHGGGTEALQAGDESAALDGGGEVAQEMGAGLVGFESPVVDLGREFDGFEGIARGDGPAFAAERVIGVSAEPSRTSGRTAGAVRGSRSMGRCPARPGSPRNCWAWAGSSSGR